MRIWGITFGPAPVHGVVVNTIDGHTFRGVMVDRTRDMIVLRAVSIYTPVQNAAYKWEPVPNDVAIPWANVSWFQTGVSAEAILT